MSAYLGAVHISVKSYQKAVFVLIGKELWLLGTVPDWAHQAAFLPSDLRLKFACSIYFPRHLGISWDS